MTKVKYTPTPAGLRVLGMSGAIQDVALQGARRVANAASQIHPSGTYRVNPAIVTAGWNNETRKGAVVSDQSDDRGGWRRRSLQRGIEKARE